MSRDFRVTSTNSFNNRFFPVGAFFNVIPDRDFSKVLRYLVNGIGFSYNGTGCRFPSDIDPGEENFDGMQFSAAGETVAVTFLEAFHYLQIACKAYVEDNPQDAREIKEQENQFQSKFCK